MSGGQSAENTQKWLHAGVDWDGVNVGVMYQSDETWYPRLTTIFGTPMESSIQRYKNMLEKVFFFLEFFCPTTPVLTKVMKMSSEISWCSEKLLWHQTMLIRWISTSWTWCESLEQNEWKLTSGRLFAQKYPEIAKKPSPLTHVVLLRHPMRVFFSHNVLYKKWKL